MGDITYASLQSASRSLDLFVLLLSDKYDSDSKGDFLDLKTGFVSGKDLMGYMHATVDNKVMDGRAHILQAFVPPYGLNDSVILCKI